MIAGKDDGEDGARGVVGEGVGFAVDAGEREVRGWRADAEDGMVDVRGLGGGEGGSKKKKKKDTDGFHEASMVLKE